MEWILVIVIRHNIFFEKRKMRIAVYNLQCTVCYDHNKTEL
jgi:hypothetical protein